MKDMSIAENLAYQFAHGLLDFDRDIKGTGGSGKNRSKLEQFEHKRLNIESDTRRIINQLLQGISKQHAEHRPRRLRMNSNIVLALKLAISHRIERNRFSGKTMLITGGAQGIGREVALRAAKEGAKVAIADWLVNEGEQICAQIRESGGQAIFILADVSSTRYCNRMIDAILKAYRTLDYAVNGATVLDAVYSGIPYDVNTQRDFLGHPIHNCTDIYWKNVIAVNVNGLFKSMRAELNQMLLNQQHTQSAIVNIGSVTTNLLFSPAYMASQYALIGLTKSAVLDYADYGIRIYALNVEHYESIIARLYQYPETVTSSRSTCSTVDYAEIVLHLLSDNASSLPSGVYAADENCTLIL
ncbi:putative oxidoreductase -like protein [Trichinella zimbabwensis]|uniref:Putative oxidoreductase-like protein n=1 Tax=Trichinella zimbabwensis TaxID=268475 RepID=A0A0V1I3Z6_9BILA|nr:putative oxidoreductase -like protein [Trichinella zimbabwensis]